MEVSMTHRRARGAFFAAFLIAGPALSQGVEAQGKDDLWEVTTKMEMPGMPMAMPGQTNRVCIVKGGKDEDFIPKRGACQMLESNRKGNKLTFKMVCATPDPMNVTGEIVYTPTTYDGRMQMSGRMQGQPMDMTQTFSGKRVGDCTAPAQ
jgi:hypothetical protein